jgi:hypothetical protein
MTAIDCISPDDLDWVLSLPDDDPRRRHVRACPRCRALVDQYVAFLEAAPEVDAARLADADARLSAALERAIGAAPARGGRIARSARVAWWETWAWRPVAAAAAVVVVAGAALLWMYAPHHEPELRGGPETAATVVVEHATLAGGAVHLDWRACPGASMYQVRVYASDLREVSRLETPETSLTLAAERLSPRLARENVVLVRIVALSGGDAIATSSAIALERR